LAGYQVVEQLAVRFRSMAATPRAAVADPTPAHRPSAVASNV